jgi:hypothetical protein
MVCVPIIFVRSFLIGLSVRAGCVVRGVLSATTCALAGRGSKPPACLKWFFHYDERDGSEPIDWRWEADCSW